MTWWYQGKGSTVPTLEGLELELNPLKRCSLSLGRGWRRAKGTAHQRLMDVHVAFPESSEQRNELGNIDFCMYLSLIFYDI